MAHRSYLSESHGVIVKVDVFQSHPESKSLEGPTFKTGLSDEFFSHQVWKITYNILWMDKKYF